jgi:hypothetical protein
MLGPKVILAGETGADGTLEVDLATALTARDLLNSGYRHPWHIAIGGYTDAELVKSPSQPNAITIVDSESFYAAMDERAWQVAKTDHPASAPAWQVSPLDRYLSVYPRGRFRDDARALLDATVPETN